MSTNPRHPKADESAITADQARQFDRAAVERLGVPSIVLMENAARAATDVILQHHSHDAYVVVCGKGNNGGDGWAIARHLFVRQMEVTVLSLAPSSALQGDAAVNRNITERLGIPCQDVADASPADQLSRWQANTLLIDAMLGTGISGVPRFPYPDWIQVMNEHPATIAAIDLPSGLDADLGEGETVIQAELTCTFVRPKVGLMTSWGQKHAGKIYVLDIGVPADFQQS